MKSFHSAMIVAALVLAAHSFSAEADKGTTNKLATRVKNKVAIQAKNTLAMHTRSKLATQAKSMLATLERNKLAMHTTHTVDMNRTFATVQVRVATKAELMVEQEARLNESAKFLDLVKAHYSELLQAANSMHAPLVLQKIIELLIDLGNKAMSETREEQREYDRFMCWCEWSLSTLDTGIQIDTGAVGALSAKILRAVANLAAAKTEIVNYLKLIVINRRQQKDATEQRKKEREEFLHDEEHLVANIEALRQAIQVLQTVQPAAFLQSSPMRQAHLLGIAGTIQRLLRNPDISKRISQDDMDALQSFAQHPSDIKGQSSNKKSLSTLEVGLGHNPFGDYATGSTRIFGIMEVLLKSLEDSLADMRATEQKRQAAYDALMITLRAELERLANEKALEERKKADFEKELAEARVDRKRTEKEIVIQKDDTEETQELCREKARAWSQRTQLRTGEMVAYRKAIGVLTGAKADATFEKVTSLRAREDLNLLLIQKEAHTRTKISQGMYKRVMQLAKKYKSSRLAEVALAMIKKGGIFDDIIVMIDNMIKNMRGEEAADIVHRDQCQVAVAANLDAKEQIDNEDAKLARLITVLEGELEEKANDLINIEQKKADRTKRLKELKENRKIEHDQFLRKQDTLSKAAQLLRQSRSVIEKFYEDQDMKLGIKPMALLQDDPPNCEGVDCSSMPACQDGGRPRWVEEMSSCCSCPEEACAGQVCPTDLCPDGRKRRLIGGNCCACEGGGGNFVFNRSNGLGPPRTSFDNKKGVSYEDMEGSGATMIIGLIEQTYKDMEMEIKMDKVYEKEAQEEYEKDVDELQLSLKELRKDKLITIAEETDLENQLKEKQDRKDEVQDEKAQNLQMKGALESGCLWVENSFEDRRVKRKMEIKGLEEARRALAKHQIDEKELGREAGTY